MCKCTPSVRTPYCGAVGCTWPEYKYFDEYEAFERMRRGKACRMKDWAEGIYIQIIDSVLYRVSDGTPVPEVEGYELQKGLWEEVGVMATSESEIAKMKYLFRYMYLTLGHYATTKNYIHGYSGPDGVAIGPDGDRGEQAREAMARVVAAGLRPKDCGVVE